MCIRGPFHWTGGIRALTRTRRLDRWHTTVTCCISLPPQTASQCPLTMAAWRPSLPGLSGCAPVLTGQQPPSVHTPLSAHSCRQCRSSQQSMLVASCVAALQSVAEANGCRSVHRVHMLQTLCCICQADACSTTRNVGHMPPDGAWPHGCCHHRALVQESFRCTLCSHAAVLALQVDGCEYTENECWCSCGCWCWKDPAEHQHPIG